MYTNPRISASLALVSLAYHLVVPQSGIDADSAVLSQQEVVLPPSDGLATLQGQALIQSASPETPSIRVRYWVIVTAYSSTPDQTDASPFITASGTHVRDGIVACNFLQFGTRIRLPQLYGNKVFVVEDRMAPKNSHKIDIWFASREAARQFGIKQTKVEVLET